LKSFGIEQKPDSDRYIIFIDGALSGNPVAGKARNLMSSIALIMFGLIFGVIAEILMFGHERVEFIIIILLGIAVILMGRHIGRVLNLFRHTRSERGIYTNLNSKIHQPITH
jgi:uncharacterized membrane protein YeaQ/YmgE (transglycosylase-associated protein family)